MPYKILGPKGHLIVRRATAARVKAILPGLRKRFGHVRVVALIIRPSQREKIVAWARWGVRNTALIHYREIRPFPLDRTLPLTTDCSGFVTLCYRLAGAPDPNGLNYNGNGYTGTLLDHGRPVLPGAVRPGDIIVYGPGTGDHTAIVVETGFDPLTVSHGQESEPSFVRVSQDGRQPQRYRRFLP